jgi:imidazolonepropionase-like amidohydrolase
MPHAPPARPCISSCSSAGARSGLLAAGSEADVICVDGDPLEDIAVLAEPARIHRLFRAGALVEERR